MHALAFHRCPLFSSSTSLPCSGLIPRLSLAVTALRGLLMLLPGFVAPILPSCHPPIPFLELIWKEECSSRGWSGHH